MFFGVSYLFWELHRAFAEMYVAALAVLSFVAWRIFDAHLRKYEQGSWRSGKAPPRREKTEILLAIILWLFVLIFFGTTIFVRGGATICDDPSPLICSLIHSRGRLQSFGRLADCWRAAVPAEEPL